jgi:hypothetical protein
MRRDRLPAGRSGRDRKSGCVRGGADERSGTKEWLAEDWSPLRRVNSNERSDNAIRTGRGG